MIMTRVSEIVLSRDAYLVCSQHVHTTDGEEVMGLLVGCYIPCDASGLPVKNGPESKQQVICDISHAVILRRSDKRKDRVEISPEMLIQAQQKAEEISSSMETGERLHIVGWYHSHPKITVAPSAVDLRTQMGYQQMDDRFVGLIFSVFNKSESTKVHEEVLGGFQAIPAGGNSYDRHNIPIRIRPTGGIAIHNQEALCTLSNILQQEQLGVLSQSRDLFSETSPMQHVYNSAVAVQRVVDICEKIPAPLSSLMHSRTRHLQASLPAMDAHIHYLTKLIKDKGLEQKYIDLASGKVAVEETKPSINGHGCNNDSNENKGKSTDVGKNTSKSSENNKLPNSDSGKIGVDANETNANDKKRILRKGNHEVVIKEPKESKVVDKCIEETDSEDEDMSVEEAQEAAVEGAIV